MTTSSAQPLEPSSLMDGLDAPAAPVPKRQSALRRRWKALAANPARKAAFVRNSWIGGAVLVAALGVGAYFLFRPMPKPDYDKDAINKVFRYTLLTDEFNKLPIEERMKLLGQIVSRLKNMSAGESALMAAFAAGIADTARNQLEENIARLMIDVWDKQAVGYQEVKDSEKDEYLDKTLIEMTKMTEALSGRVRDIPDDQRLEEVHKQVERDRAYVNDPKHMPNQADFGRMFSVMENNVGSHASPIKRLRGTQLMRDMGRHLRNEDVGSGKPRGGG